MSSRRITRRAKPTVSSATTLGSRLCPLEKLGLSVHDAEDSLGALLARLNETILTELGHATAGPMYFGLTRAERIVLTAVCGPRILTVSNPKGKSIFHKLFMDAAERHRPKQPELKLWIDEGMAYHKRHSVKWRGRTFNFRRPWHGKEKW